MNRLIRRIAAGVNLARSAAARRPSLEARYPWATDSVDRPFSTYFTRWGVVFLLRSRYLRVGLITNNSHSARSARTKARLLMATSVRSSRWLAYLAAAAILAATLAAVAWGGTPANAVSATSNGWTTSGVVNATTVSRGNTAIVTVTVKSSIARSALIDVEVYAGASKVYQKWWDAQSFTAGQTRTYKTSWTVPATAALAPHTVRVGIFGNGWTGLQHWNHDVATFTVTASPTHYDDVDDDSPDDHHDVDDDSPDHDHDVDDDSPDHDHDVDDDSPTTTTSTTTRPTTTTTRPPAGGRFATLPVGAALPSDADCAARVRPTSEIRSYNAPYNQTRGSAPNSGNPRVTGNFTGTTDEILQWAACKWGIDEDIVRAQIAKESWWKHDSRGDLTSDQTRCHPELRTTNGTACPESYGLGQVRYAYHTSAMTDSIHSSAYNVDYTYSIWRSCFEGRETWLNQFERGRQYAAGDAWGCVGLWFSGRWYTQPANDYISAVQSYLNQRIWTTAPFINFPG